MRCLNRVQSLRLGFHSNNTYSPSQSTDSLSRSLKMSAGPDSTRRVGPPTRRVLEKNIKNTLN